jgi:hypothetical protein
MAMVTVYRFEVYNVVTDQTTVRPREGTLDAILRTRRLQPLMETAREVDESELDGDGFVRRQRVHQGGNTRPCTQAGCSGTQTYSPLSYPPGSQAGTGVADGVIVWDADPQQGWSCSVDRDHWQCP